VLRDVLDTHIAGTVGTVITNADVRVIGFRELKDSSLPNTESLGIYLHRISVDPFGRNRYLQPARDDQPPQPELPVNLHLLLIGWSPTTGHEAALLGWGMQQIGAALDLDISHLSSVDPQWGEGERVQVIPEEMSTEDLLRIWDGLPRDYMLSSPYVIKTVRLAPIPELNAGEPVRTLTHVLGELS